jgi:hypothetical protein
MPTDSNPMDSRPADSNVRSRSYLIALAHQLCGQCGRSTRVLALAVPPGHETADSESEDGGPWQRADAPAFLFFLTWLPDGVLQRLLPHALYQRTHGEESSASHWANHCEHCGSALSDEELHCEPGVFMPGGKAEAGQIQMLTVDEAFEAATAGYAVDPEFIQWPSTSST